jgi:hypothetical protein
MLFLFINKQIFYVKCKKLKMLKIASKLKNPYFICSIKFKLKNT